MPSALFLLGEKEGREGRKPHLGRCVEVWVGGRRKGRRKLSCLISFFVRIGTSLHPRKRRTVLDGVERKAEGEEEEG